MFFSNGSLKDQILRSELKQFLMVKEVAVRYRTSTLMIYRWVSEKRFPENVVFRLGRKILFHRQNLEAFEVEGGDLFQKSKSEEE